MSQPALQVSKHNVDISLPSVTSTSSEVKSSQSIAFLWSQTPLLVAALCLVLLVAVLGLACARWLFVEGSTFIRFFGTILYVCESFVLWFGFVPNKSLVLDKYFFSNTPWFDPSHPPLRSKFLFPWYSQRSRSCEDSEAHITINPLGVNNHISKWE